MTEKMKPSGIAWIGDVPESWEICRIKDLCTIARGGSPRPIDEYLSDNPSDINWIRIGDTTKGNKYITQTEQKIIKQGISSSRMVFDGDLLLTNSMSFGQPYIMKTCGCIHDGWLVFSDYHRIDKLFLYYVLMSELCLVQFKTSVAGAVVENLSIDKVGISKIFLPSLEEQGAIVNFLDTQCAKIDSVIADIEKQIETLQKYKKSLITEAVTKGLDQSVPMKDSGVACIGLVPATWNYKKLGYMAEVTKLAGFEFTDYFEYVDEGVIAVRGLNLKNFDISLVDIQHIPEKTSDMLPRSQVHYNDVLISYAGTVGSIGLITDTNRRYHLAPNVGKVTILSELIPRYLAYYLVSYAGQEHIDQLKNKNAQESISMENIRRIKVLVPTQAEQQNICDYLDKKVGEIDTLIGGQQKKLELMQAHKKSQIYEYVTGKKRVTEVN